MHRKALEPIRQAGDREHEKALTQTVRVASSDSIPPGYRRFPVKSPAIYAKVQVLSSKLGMPVFIETPSVHLEQRVAYWVHEDVLPELAQWLRIRVFPITEIVDHDARAATNS
ncbi:MAG: hypothetical protein O3C40_29650 [Planctomycetota bacterium]|nr:hypothetical protein [Planctomycetota bacterium]